MKLEQRNLERSKYVAERCSVGSSRESAGMFSRTKLSVFRMERRSIFEVNDIYGSRSP